MFPRIALHCANICGPTGPTGPTGPAFGSIIPFASNNDISPAVNSSNQLTRTQVLGFGSSSGNIPVTGGDTFTLDSNSEFYTFPMPYDGRIVAVEGRYSTITAWTAPSNMRLYIAVAIAPENSRTYKIAPTSKALAPPYVQGVRTADREVRTGSAPDVNIPVLKGQNIAVVVGSDNTGGGVSQTLPFNFTGSIVIEKT